jgi:protein TonB
MTRPSLPFRGTRQPGYGGTPVPLGPADAPRSKLSGGRPHWPIGLSPIGLAGTALVHALCVLPVLLLLPQTRLLPESPEELSIEMVFVEPTPSPAEPPASPPGQPASEPQPIAMPAEADPSTPLQAPNPPEIVARAPPPLPSDEQLARLEPRPEPPPPEIVARAPPPLPSDEQLARLEPRPEPPPPEPEPPAAADEILPLPPPMAPPPQRLAIARKSVAAPPAEAPAPPRASVPQAASPPALAAEPAPVAVPVSLQAAWNRALEAWIAQHKTYPEPARRRGIQGSVVLRFSVDRSGRVVEVVLLRGSGSPILDAAAEAMLRDAMLPPPPMQDRVTVSVPVHYTLVN